MFSTGWVGSILGSFPIILHVKLPSIDPTRPVFQTYKNIGYYRKHYPFQFQAKKKDYWPGVGCNEGVVGCTSPIRFEFSFIGDHTSHLPLIHNFSRYRAFPIVPRWMNRITTSHKWRTSIVSKTQGASVRIIWSHDVPSFTYPKLYLRIVLRVLTKFLIHLCHQFELIWRVLGYVERYGA